MHSHQRGLLEVVGEVLTTEVRTSVETAMLVGARDCGVGRHAETRGVEAARSWSPGEPVASLLRCDQRPKKNLTPPAHDACRTHRHVVSDRRRSQEENNSCLT